MFDDEIFIRDALLDYSSDLIAYFEKLMVVQDQLSERLGRVVFFMPHQSQLAARRQLVKFQKFQAIEPEDGYLAMIGAVNEIDNIITNYVPAAVSEQEGITSTTVKDIQAILDEGWRLIFNRPTRDDFYEHRNRLENPDPLHLKEAYPKIKGPRAASNDKFIDDILKNKNPGPERTILTLLDKFLSPTGDPPDYAGQAEKLCKILTAAEKYGNKLYEESNRAGTVYLDKLPRIVREKIFNSLKLEDIEKLSTDSANNLAAALLVKDPILFAKHMLTYYIKQRNGSALTHMIFFHPPVAEAILAQASIDDKQGEVIRDYIANNHQLTNALRKFEPKQFIKMIWKDMMKDGNPAYVGSLLYLVKQNDFQYKKDYLKMMVARLNSVIGKIQGTDKASVMRRRELRKLKLEFRIIYRPITARAQRVKRRLHQKLKLTLR